MSTYISCLICSCLSFLLTMLLVKYCPISGWISFLFSGVESIIIYIMEPVENINRPVDNTENYAFSYRIRQTLILIFILAFIFLILKKYLFLDVITYTLAGIIVSMLLDKLKNGIIGE